MHLGHVRLAELCKQRAAERRAKVALFTFSNNHLALLGREQKVLYTFEERLDIYRSLNVDYVIAAEFDEKFRDNNGNAFVNMLKRYCLKGVVCGFDYTYGRDKKDCNDLVHALTDVCDVDIVDAICIDGAKVSTTMLRGLIANGNVQAANDLLSQPFFVTGTVAHGRQVGHQMGFPTANLKVAQDKLLPIGVFGGKAQVGETVFPAIINIGQKPTFDLDGVSVEAHLLGFDGDLYGKQLKLSLTQFLRPICKFDSKEQLSEQLRKDKERVQND